MIKSLCKSVFFLYFLAGILIYVAGSRHVVFVRRIDNVSQWAGYPLQDKKPTDREFRYSILYYKLLVGGYSNFSEADNMVGYCYYQLKEYRWALKYFDKALKINPNHFWVIYNKGITKYSMGQQDAALLDFEEILKKDQGQLLKDSVLSLLRKYPEDRRKKFFFMARDFACLIRQNAWYMKVLINKEKGWNEKAVAAAVAAVQDALVKDKAPFLVFLISEELAGGDSQKAGKYCQILDVLGRDARYPKKNCALVALSVAGQDSGMLSSLKSAGETGFISFVPDVFFHPWGKSIPIGKEKYY